MISNLSDIINPRTALPSDSGIFYAFLKDKPYKNGSYRPSAVV